MEELLNRLKERKFDNKRLEAYVVNPNVTSIYTREQLTELRALWYGEEAMKDNELTLNAMEEDLDDCIQTEDIFDDMTKDQLDEYSINTYGIDLDKRFTKENMLEELDEELNKLNKY